MERKETGKVYLVGAGPSDPGLFTLKGRAVLEKADVVVYDALTGDGILSMIPQEAEKIYAGKRSGSHAMKQEDISRLLCNLAKEGKNVVRLKGGDPFLFGRGGEEMELLADEEIPFEIVPGIPSAISVPAYQGIPVTHRDYCSSLHIITGHRMVDRTDGTDFDALVRLGGTLVFLMGTAAMGSICSGLMKAGMDKKTPAALLIKGTTAHQRCISATLGTLEEEAAGKGVATPAIIVVGGVCELAEKYSWYGKMPLGGVKVMLTRPADLAEKTAGMLRLLGAEVVAVPTIRTVVRDDNRALYDALENIDSFDWLVFTSRIGVRCFFAAAKDRKIDTRRFAGIRVASVGPGTSKELENYGIYADLMPDIFDGEHLGSAIAAEGKPGERVLIPRAAAGNAYLTENISHMDVCDIPIYDTIYEKPEDAAKYQDELNDGSIDYVIFTSASCVRGFVQAFDKTDFGRMKAVCIGKQTMAEAEKYGMRTFVAKEASIESIVECLTEIHNSNKL